MTYRTQRDFEMRECDFPPETEDAIKKWLYEQIRVRRQQLRKRHTVKVPEWRRIAEGRPKEEHKSWPFENCANLVHQVVGEACDEQAARVLALIWNVPPIIQYRYFTKADENDQAAENTKKSRLLEQFMDYAAFEPAELNLYNKENIWFSDSTKIGTAWIAVVPCKRKEAVYLGYHKEKKRSSFEDVTVYEGPKVINLRDEDVLYDPYADEPEESDFFSRRITLTKRQLQEREFDEDYRKGSVAAVLGKPDRYGPDETKRKADKGKGYDSSDDQQLAEWDFEECYFYWFHNSKKFRLIAWFHWESKTLMNLVFNFIPDNQLPVVRTRLFSGEKGMNGRGFAEIGEHAQEEISTTKNQRIDAVTWGILGINRIDTSNRNVDRNFKIFPGMSIPLGKDQFEHISVAEPAMHGISQKNEEMMIQQARERFGVGAAVAGQGTGHMQGKGRNAFYSAMGSLAAMQDSNTRSAHRTSDFRQAHVRLFSLLTDMYGAMGLGRKGSLFGMDEKILEKALQDFLERRVKIPMRAANATSNREVLKQNQLILNQAITMFAQSQSQRIQAVYQQTPPEYKKWLIGIIKGQTRLFHGMIREFQISEQPEEFVPTIEFPPEIEGANGAEKGANPGVVAMAQRIQKPGGNAASPGQGGMEGLDEGLPGALAGAVP